ncbi:MAG: hypothetical protein WA862_06740 [Solirubrobacterales bacterium]
MKRDKASTTSKRLRGSLAGALAIALGLLAPGAAAAAPALTPVVTHTPSTLNRGDSYMTYQVSVENSGDAATTAPVNVTVGLPAGMSINEGSGSGWTCFLTPKTCTYSPTGVAANDTLPLLSIGVDLDDATLPAAPTVTVTAFGGGAPSAGIGQETLTLGPQLVFGAIPASFKARSEDELGADYTQAGGHPFKATTAFDFVKKAVKPKTFALGTFIEAPFENARDGAISLPPGFVANPTALPGGCEIGQVVSGTCPERFAVGIAHVNLGPTNVSADEKAVVYKIQAEDGYPAAFAVRPVNVSGATVVLRPKIRPQDFTVTALIPRPVQNPELYGVTYFTFCSYGAKTEPWEGTGWRSAGCKQPTDAGSLATPFITNPTRCTGVPDVVSLNLASYQHPGAFDEEGFPDLSDSDWKTTTTTAPALTGCNNLEFEPTFEGRPTTNVADAPTGLDFNLHIPQHGLVGTDSQGDPAPEALAAAHLKDTTVTLPAGMTVNPSAANGLEACTSKQMGLIETDHAAPYAIRFDGKPVACPTGSKIGNVTIESPLVEQTIEGGVYLGKQYNNPFNSLLAIYIAVRNDEIGLSAKLAGKVTPDPVTGQLTAVFKENPQLPFEDLKLKFFEGPGASLRTPATCGPKTTIAEFTPWSAPQSGPPASRSDSFATATAPGGGNCAQSVAGLPNAPRLTAGTVIPKAGAYSPFVLRIARDDGSQELKGINATLPPGLTGRLAGVPYCSEVSIQQAIARSHPGEGATEQSSPSCPAASRVGTVDTAAGAGPTPFHAPGKAYLAGPYKGAPVSMVVIAPAVAGPFDLGTVVIRNALYINPVTAQVSVKSDPIPTILYGIPLDVRSVEVQITRNQFTLNPTNCEPLTLGATAIGLTSEAGLSSRFQVGECAALGFKPGLKLKLRGSTKRAKYQQLTATVTYPKGSYANIARASVALPHSAFLAQQHIRTVCTRVQFAAKECPQGAVYGSAEAITPLLDEPLKGPVYLRSSSNPLPDLVAALRGSDGQPVEVELAGRTDSVHGGIRNTFDLVPDAPVSKFTLRLFGGKKSLIVNSRNLCKGVQRATAKFTAQNGRRYESRPVVRNSCRGHRGGKKGKKGTGHNRRPRSASSLARILRAW